MNRLLREAVAAALAGQPNMAVVGATAEITDLISLCRLRPVTVVVMDVGVDLAEVLESVRLMRSVREDLGVVFTFAHLSARNVATAHREGVTRLIPYARGMSAVVEAVREGPDGAADRRRRLPMLTERDLEILSLMSSGYSVREMADMLRIAQSTVQNHKRRIFAKMSANSQAHVVSLAARMGLLWSGTNARPSVPSTGHGNLVVVLGPDGPRRDMVVQSLVTQAVPVLVSDERWEESGNDALMIRGPVVAVLVEESAKDWQSVRMLGAKAVVVTDSMPHQRTVAEALVRGADAMLSINDVPGRLVHAVALAAHESGSTTHAPGMVASIAERSPGIRSDLSTRELEILRSIAVGHSVRQTGRALGITSKTVENIQTRLFRKLSVRNRAEALAVAYSLGLVAND